LVPETLLLASRRDGVIVPHFLGPHDHPWLRTVLDEHSRFVGRPRRELDERFQERLPCTAPQAKLRLAVHVLRRVWPTQRPSGLVSSRALRGTVFMEAARSREDPPAVVERVAARLGMSTAALQEGLFGDLPGERLVAEPPPSLEPVDLSLRINLALAQGLLFRAVHVRIAAAGDVRRIVRLAKLQGLICTVRPQPQPVLSISGPYALFRRTLVYGRALAALLPPLAWCPRFHLEAECMLAGAPAALHLQSGDPIFPGSEPRRFASRVEERFARDVARLAPEWNVVREPEAIPAGGSLLFPDFALEHRHDGRRWLIEILGFWSPTNVTRKLAGLRAAGIPNLVLCIAEERNCAEDELPPLARVVRYRRWVDAAAVLQAIQEAAVT
jgi:predicted nuclease of restriction endonuclease-like RecB superfamily